VKFREFRGSTLPLAIFLFQQKILFSASPRFKILFSSNRKTLPWRALRLGGLKIFSSTVESARRAATPYLIHLFQLQI